MQVGFQRQKMTLTDERVSKIDELLQALPRRGIPMLGRVRSEYRVVPGGPRRAHPMPLVMR
jgi:hypothetical protein